MHQQLYEYFNSILSPKQCGFWKGYSAQHCLMVMLEKFKESRDKGEEFGGFFRDLSKAFNCIDHNLLVTKLSWYRITPTSLKLIFSYLINRPQGVRINNSYSKKVKLTTVSPIPQCLGGCCLMLIWLTSFLNARMITLLATMMTLFPTPVHKIYHLENVMLS